MSAFMLASRNVRKSFHEYSVYFLTIVIGVAMFYVFNSIESQSVMMELSENQTLMLLGLNTIMSYLSVFISIILGFLILYANAFLIRRRKKELGIYMALGMKKGKLSQILICETALVGTFSLAIGLLFGIFISQALAVLTANIYGVSLNRFVFVFSTSALWKSVIYFGAAFLFVMLFNTTNISRQELVDLIYADKMTSRFRAPHLGISVVLFLVSLAMLAMAYYMVLSRGFVGIFANNGFQIIPISLGIIGTFLFFYTFSGFFLKLVSKAKNIYFKDLNLFTLGQFSSKMNTAHLSMSFVCLMLFLSISSISVGSALAESIHAGYSQSEAGTVAGITYAALYIGIVFMLTCASVLAVAQLSEANDNRARYLLLSKLGASDRLLAGSLFKQIFFYFALPLVLALMHSVIAIIVMSDLIAIIGEINILITCLTSGLAIIALYGGYFLMTFFSAKTIGIQR